MEKKITLESEFISPFQPLISFQKIVDSLESSKENLTDFQLEYVSKLLAEIYKYPELLCGIERFEELEKYEPVIKVLLADLFPMLLSKNEIKAVTIPYHLKILNLSERFQKILSDAGESFELNIRGLSDQNFYILNCCVILKVYFNHKIEITDTPLFIDIPDQNGVIRHYRVLINADFMEILPTERSKILTEEEIKELLDNFENIELWKEKFPENSWILKGFSIMNLFDATIENAISTLKGNLLSEVGENKLAEVSEIFRSIYRIPELKIGFTVFGNFLQKLDVKVIDHQFYSHLLSESSVEECDSIFCDDTVMKLVTEKEYLVVSDLDGFQPANRQEMKMSELLKSQKVKSAIFVPLFDKDKLLGILELSSPNKDDFNSVNAHKLDYIVPFIQDKVANVLIELENEIEAIIQKEYTAIHPSVLWRFKEEAFEYLNHRKMGVEYALKEIVFADVYPLYGQIDVQGSSVSRNEAIQKDFIFQIETLIELFELAFSKAKLPLFEHKIYELRNHLDELKELISSNTEQFIQNYIESDIHPILQNFRQNTSDKEIVAEIEHYFEKSTSFSGKFHTYRREFDESISLINKKLASILDEKQIEAQRFFPHYYERFKTDGVEHNMYIGASITPGKDFNIYYLKNLRLWQMQVMCEMENHFRLIQSNLPNELEVSSLILVFGTPISIRFRMDEKQFDIDGSYNVRYEIAKKRIDKAKIKNSEERITQKGKLTIVYQTAEEEKEYLGYIKLLQHKGMLDTDVESFFVEDLQGIVGLKGLRVGFLYHSDSKLYADYKTIETETKA